MPCAASTSTTWLLPGFLTSTLPLTACATTVFPGTGVGVGLGVGVAVGTAVGATIGCAVAVGVGVGVGVTCELSSVKPRVAGDGSGPALLSARTVNVCAPSARLPYGCGESQAAKAAPSRLHSNPAPSWSAVNENTGDASCVSPDGPPVIVVSGGVPVVTINERVAGVASNASLETARMSTVCVPSASAGVVYCVAQAANGRASTRHSKLAPAVPEENVNVGVASVVSPLGPPVIVVSGAGVVP